METTLTIPWLRRLGHLMAASGMTAFVSLALITMHADATTAGILYLVMVVWASTFAGSFLSIYLAIIASLFLDYFFLPPIYHLDLNGFQSWLAMIAFVASCVIVNRVAERARRQTRLVVRRREDVERLYSLSQEMMLHEDAAGLVREIPRLVAQNFALDAVLLYVRDEDQLYASVPSADAYTEGQPFSPDRMRVALKEVSAAWEPNSELPQGYTPLNLVFGMSSVGTLAWKPSTLSREVATSIAAQVAIAITRAHAIERSLSLEAARSADRLRTALIDSLTHELRTPLTAIRAAATTLLDLPSLDDETRTELATIVDEESSRLDSLIGEAMEVAEIESDGVRVRLEPLHTGTFLEQAVEESHSQLIHHALTILVEQPDHPAWFDPHILGRVLRHLLENAARYTPPKTRILLRSRRCADRLEFLVEDDGPGIDSHDLPQIFDKFYRGKRRNSAAKGSGMGLSITRALLTAHGGGIEVQSTPGKGSIFRLWVPLVEKSPTAALERLAASDEDLRPAAAANHPTRRK